MTNQNRPTNFLESLFPKDLPSQMGTLLEMFRHMSQTLDELLEATRQDTPPEVSQPQPFEVKIPNGQSYVTSRHIYITNLIISSDTAGTVSLFVGETTPWFDIDLAVNTPIQLLFPGLDAKEVMRGLVIHYTAPGAAIVKLYLKGWTT